jgi:hypothetical protein
MGMIISHVIILHNINKSSKQNNIYEEKKDEYEYYKLEDEILVSDTS